MVLFPQTIIINITKCTPENDEISSQFYENKTQECRFYPISGFFPQATSKAICVSEQEAFEEGKRCHKL